MHCSTLGQWVSVIRVYRNVFDGFITLLPYADAADWRPYRSIAEPDGGLKVTEQHTDIVLQCSSRYIAGNELGWRAVT